MANYCSFSARIYGGETNTREFLEVLKTNEYYGMPEDPKHFWGIQDITVVSDEDEPDVWVIGGCDWSLEYALLANPESKYITCPSDKNFGTYAAAECKRLRVSFEAFSEEPDMGVSEHLYISDEGEVLLYDNDYRGEWNFDEIEEARLLESTRFQITEVIRALDDYKKSLLFLEVAGICPPKISKNWFRTKTEILTEARASVRDALVKIVMSIKDSTITEEFLGMLDEADISEEEVVLSEGEILLTISTELYTQINYGNKFWNEIELPPPVFALYENLRDVSGFNKGQYGLVLYDMSDEAMFFNSKDELNRLVMESDVAPASAYHNKDGQAEELFTI